MSVATVPCFGRTFDGAPLSVNGRRMFAAEVRAGRYSGDTGMAHGPITERESWPARLRVSAERWRAEGARSGPRYAAECEAAARRAERLANQLEAEAGHGR